MSSHYTQGLEMVARVREQVHDIKPDTVEHSVAVEQWNALEQSWITLRMTFLATAKAADEAIIASNRQHVRHRVCVRMMFHAGDLRTWHANNCIRYFKYVTDLSNYARVKRQHHASELVCMENVRDHYEESALGSQTDKVRSHQMWLATLDRNIEAVKLAQGLEMVCIRWQQLRAAATLAHATKKFHMARARVAARKERSLKAARRANDCQKKVARRVEEYELLEPEVMDVQRALQALEETLFGSTSAVSASVSGEKADETV